MSKLEHLLSDWVSNKLITKEQAELIGRYEKQKEGHSWVFFGFLILSAVVIGIGVISLVAANWESIPDSLKLFVDFTLLVALSIGTYFSFIKKKDLFFEVLIVFFMMLCLASIGLISQIYHTGGELYQALLIWSFLTSGLAFISRSFFAPFLWALGLFSSLTYAGVTSSRLQMFFQGNESPVFMTIPLLSGLFALFCRNLFRESSQVQALRWCAVVGGALALATVEIKAWGRSESLSILSFVPGYIISCLIMVNLWVSLQYKKIQKIVLITLMFCYLALFHLQLFNLNSSLWSAVLSLLILSFMSLFLASLKYRRMFQFFLIILGLRFLVLYFQAFGGLSMTGFGLIFAGILIMGGVLLWHKYSKDIAEWAERLTE